jgi:hypothetical protein
MSTGTPSVTLSRFDSESLGTTCRWYLGDSGTCMLSVDASDHKMHNDLYSLLRAYRCRRLTVVTQNVSVLAYRCIIYYDCFMLIVKHEEMLLRS